MSGPAIRFLCSKQLSSSLNQCPVQAPSSSRASWLLRQNRVFQSHLCSQHVSNGPHVLGFRFSSRATRHTDPSILQAASLLMVGDSSGRPRSFHSSPQRSSQTKLREQRKAHPTRPAPIQASDANTLADDLDRSRGFRSLPEESNCEGWLLNMHPVRIRVTGQYHVVISAG